MKYKICTRCKDELPKTEEYFHRYKNGLRSVCRICRQINAIKKYRGNKESSLQTSKDNYYKNKDDRLIKSRKWYRKNRDKVSCRNKQYRIINSNKISAKNKVRNTSLIKFVNICFQKLSLYEDIRIDPQDGSLGQVKCRYCGKYFNPTLRACRSRLDVILGYGHGECNLYCSSSCKEACPSFNQKEYPKGFKVTTSREMQPELRKLVLERDTWECRKCGKTQQESQLHCHHVEGIRHNPIESADIDMCITLCKECHKAVHRIEGCTYIDMRCAS